MDDVPIRPLAPPGTPTDGLLPLGTGRGLLPFPSDLVYYEVNDTINATWNEHPIFFRSF